MIYNDQRFLGQTINIDFANFSCCRFERCQLIYSGYGPYSFTDCEFVACNWGFEGPAANAIHLLQSINTMPGGSNFVDEMIATIRATPAEPSRQRPN